ncbi:hypothetical protein J6J28_06395 [Pseudidiomarina sp. 1ASP75-5]|nr:hypothetical protein [Pseudidiomarina sp. 1ASP75-5]
MSLTTLATLVLLTGCNTEAIIKHAGTQLTKAEAEKLLADYEQQVAYLKEQNAVLQARLATPEQLQMQEDVRRLKSMLLPSDKTSSED